MYTIGLLASSLRAGRAHWCLHVGRRVQCPWCCRLSATDDVTATGTVDVGASCAFVGFTLSRTQVRPLRLHASIVLLQASIVLLQTSTPLCRGHELPDGRRRPAHRWAVQEVVAMRRGHQLRLERALGGSIVD